MLPNSLIGIIEFLFFYYAFPIALFLSIAAAVFAFTQSTRRASWAFATSCIVFCTAICLLVIWNVSQNHSQDFWKIVFGVCAKLVIPMIIAGAVCWYDGRVSKKRDKHGHDA